MPNALGVERQRPLVMVVDDDPSLLQLFHDVLTGECDYVVSPHPRLPPTLEDIRRVAPDVLIMDHRLAEGVRGWDVIREICQTSDLYDLPIVFCTADRKHLERVADDLATLRITPLIKPFSIDQLVGDVGQALRLQGIDPTPCA